MSFSDDLRDASRDAWDAMQRHRFVADIESDRLPPEVFRRYLVYEGAFVETAIVIFGHAMVKAPGLAERRRLIAVLHALAEEQIPYFERSFAALSVDPEACRPFPASVERFRDGMRETAERGDYGDIVVAMLAAEWTYATWCARAARRPIGDPELRRWVDLHAEPAFAAQADWLRDQVDAVGAAASSERRQQLMEVFRRTLVLEIAFHDAPYG